MSRSRGAVVRTVLLLVYVLLARSDAGAQAATVSLRGTVYDSLAHAPLAGAVIQAVRSAGGHEDPARWATADSLGQFEIMDLPAGRYAIGFQHPRLTNLGLESPIAAIEAAGDSVLRVALSTPSAGAARAALCGNKAADGSDGMLAGTAVRATGGDPLDSVTVNFEWFELGVRKGKLVSAPVKRTLVTDERGAFRACGLPGGATVRISVTRRGFVSLEGDVLLDPDELWYRQIRLAPATAPGADGSGVIVGRVAGQDSAAVQSGRAAIYALGLEVPIRNGGFTFGKVPPGTWIIDVASIGHEPSQQWADVTARATTPVAFALTPKAQTLERVTVVGKAGRDLQVLEGIQERSRVAAGTMFLPGNSWLVGSTMASDVVRAARGFSYKSPNEVYARGTGGPSPECGSRLSDIPNRKTPTGGQVGKEIAIYVDGVQWRMGLEAVNDAIPAKDILAVEAYPDVSSAPFLWRTNDACAVIAFWTKRQ